MSKDLLIDVRTPEEFSTGYLDGAINIEYQAIDQLKIRTEASQGDHIRLYCRSGRRSAIAKGVLQELGFQDVRDLGSLEEARAVLQEEKMNRFASYEAKSTGQASFSKAAAEDAYQALLDDLRMA